MGFEPTKASALARQRAPPTTPLLHLFSALHGSRTRTLLLLRTCFLDKRVYQFHQKGKLFKYPDRDSNPDHKIRSLAFYSVELSGHLFVLGEGFKPTNISRYTRFVDEGGHSVTLYPSKLNSSR